MLEFRLLIIRLIEPIFNKTIETVVPKKATILRVPTVTIALVAIAPAAMAPYT